MPAIAPTLSGFILFIRDIMGIPSSVLPDNSSSIVFCFDLASEEVNQQLLAASPVFYSFAVYNCGGDYLINYAVDNPALTPPDNTYFAELRKKYNVYSFVAGVIESSYDAATGQSIAVPEALRELTLSDLQHMKTPWGREYLAIAQKVGSQWGLTQ